GAHFDLAASKMSADLLAQRRFGQPQVVGKAQAEVQIAAIDRADFEGDAAHGRFGPGGAEGGHAAYHEWVSCIMMGNLYYCPCGQSFSSRPGVFLSYSPVQRPSGRQPDQLRPVSLETGYTRHAEGSVLIRMGDTHVLCNASVLDKVPPFLKGRGQGWVTAEYGMLPRSTHTRSDREAARGKQSGRTQEIQRLIGRSLRAVFDLQALGERTLHLDCDVLQADGGTRCASITGAWLAAALAVRGLVKGGMLSGNP